MTRLARLYGGLFRIAFLEQIQYRASNVIWMIGMVLEPIVFLVVWTSVAESRGDVAGLGPRDFAAYYIVVLVVNHLTFSWIMHVFQYRIQQGSLSFELLRPVHPIHNDLCANFAYKIQMLVILTPAIVLMIIGFDPRFDLQLGSLLAFVPALILGFAVRFLFEWTLALAAFWTTRTMAMNQIYFAVMTFLSGRIAPLAVFPDLLRDAAAVLPFYYMVAFPVEVFLGQLAPAEMLRGFGFQVFWVGVAAATIASAWRFSARRFTAVGA